MSDIAMSDIAMSDITMNDKAITGFNDNAQRIVDKLTIPGDSKEIQKRFKRIKRWFGGEMLLKV